MIVSDGRLSARPRNGVKTSATGQIKLGLDSERDAMLQIPKNAGQSPLPLVGDVARRDAKLPTRCSGIWVRLTKKQESPCWRQTLATQRGTRLAVQISVIDVEYLNRMLERVFETTAIDPARVSIGRIFRWRQLRDSRSD